MTNRKKDMKLEDYGEWRQHIMQEGGISDFVTGYASPEYFKDDAELFQLALIVADSTNEFNSLLASKIRNLGGDPNDWEY